MTVRILVAGRPCTAPVESDATPGTSVYLLIGVPPYATVSAGRETIVRELIGAGANVNTKTSQGMTPLYDFQLAYYSKTSY